MNNFNKFYAEIHTKRYTTVKALVKCAWDNRQLEIDRLTAENERLKEEQNISKSVCNDCETNTAVREYREQSESLQVKLQESQEYAARLKEGWEGEKYLSQVMHTKANKAEAKLARYEQGVEVEGKVWLRMDKWEIRLCNEADLSEIIGKRVRVLVMPLEP